MSQCKYPGCSYLDDQHRPYARMRDGVPSVTAVASSLDVDDRGRAFAWSASLIAATTAVHETPRWWHLPTHGKDGPCTHDKTGLCLSCRFIRSEFDRVWRAKMALGGHIHHLALQWAKGETVDTDKTTEPYMNALELFYQERHPEFLHLERTVRYGTERIGSYRGQFDFIANLHRENDDGTIVETAKTGLWDIKTGGFYPIEQTLQLAAYRYATWLTTWEDKHEYRVTPMPPVDEAGVLMLHDDGTYELIPLPADWRAFHRFRALLASWHWAKGIEKWNKERESAA